MKFEEKASRDYIGPMREVPPHSQANLLEGFLLAMKERGLKVQLGEKHFLFHSIQVMALCLRGIGLGGQI